MGAAYLGTGVVIDVADGGVGAVSHGELVNKAAEGVRVSRWWRRRWTSAAPDYGVQGSPVRNRLGPCVRARLTQAQAAARRVSGSWNVLAARWGWAECAWAYE